jgi:hypothetical protein
VLGKPATPNVAGECMSWKTEAWPRHGWVYRADVEDLGDLVGHCDSCGRDNQHRYRHPLLHLLTGLRANVGRECAERLTGDCVGPLEREQIARQRVEPVLPEPRLEPAEGRIVELRNWTQPRPKVREFGGFELRQSRFSSRWAVFMDGKKVDGYRYSRIESAHRRAVELSREVAGS